MFYISVDGHNRNLHGLRVRAIQVTDNRDYWFFSASAGGSGPFMYFLQKGMSMPPTDTLTEVCG